MSALVLPRAKRIVGLRLLLLSLGAVVMVLPFAWLVSTSFKPDSLVLHLTARPLKGGGSWPGVSEDWIVYTPAEVKRLLPAGAVRTGTTWSPEKTLGPGWRHELK